MAVVSAFQQAGGSDGASTKSNDRNTEIIPTLLRGNDVRVPQMPQPCRKSSLQWLSEVAGSC